MAIEVGNIPAFDQSTITGIGLAVPFKNNPTQLTSLIEYPDFLASPVHNGDPVFTINYTTSEQIKYNLINYFLHMKGERIFNPNFGSVASNFVFETIDDTNINLFRKQIQEEIDLVFPQIKVSNLEVIPDPEYHTITVQIYYSVFSSLNEFVEFNFVL